MKFWRARSTWDGAARCVRFPLALSHRSLHLNYIAANATATAAPPTTQCALPVTIGMPPVLTLELLLELISVSPGSALVVLPVELLLVCSDNAPVVVALVEVTELAALAEAPGAADAVIVTT
jgi:hypothetical protein